LGEDNQTGYWRAEEEYPAGSGYRVTRERLFMMRRRVFLNGLMAAIGTGAVSVLAPQSATARNKRVGILHPLSGPPDALPSVAALLAGFRELGLESGRTVEIEFGWGEGKMDLLVTRAEQLVAGAVDVLVGGAGPGFAAALRATSSIAIVMAASSFDPSRDKVPRNVCGASIFLPGVPEARLRLLKELSPSARMVGVIVNPANPQSDRLVAEYEAAGQAVGLATQRVSAASVAEFEESVARARAGGVNALVAVQGADIFRLRKEIARVALEAKLPAVTGEEEFAESGGLAKLAPSITTAWHRAAWYVHQVLNGMRPDALGVEVPSKAELIINRSTARALGLNIPPAVTARADRLVD
jgi:putative ABC transport system substrate-binding protein